MNANTDFWPKPFHSLCLPSRRNSVSPTPIKNGRITLANLWNVQRGLRLWNKSTRRIAINYVYLMWAMMMTVWAGRMKFDFWAETANIDGSWSSATPFIRTRFPMPDGLVPGEFFVIAWDWIQRPWSDESFHDTYSTDINDQKAFEQKLKEAHDAAQKSTESKTRFLSNMSHGNPSTSLCLFTKLGFVSTCSFSFSVFHFFF